MKEPSPYDAILEGNREIIPFPEDPFVRWEIVQPFLKRCDTPEKTHAAFIWLVEKAPVE
jgi:hypothetical protein